MSAILKVRRHLGENIRLQRKAAGWSQEKLAEMADLHPVYISQVERGKNAVSVEALWRLSRALKTSIAALFRNV